MRRPATEDAPCPQAADRLAERARRALAAPDARIVPLAGGGGATQTYALRQGVDQRRRPRLVLDAASFAVLARGGTLSPSPQGGFVLSRAAAARTARDPEAFADRPGRVLTEVMQPTPQGEPRRVKVNLARSAVSWLASRCDGNGQPFLSDVERAAAERLEADADRAAQGARLVQSWSLPLSGGRAPGDSGPEDAARAARRRLVSALAAAPPLSAAVLRRVCLDGGGLVETEKALGLPRRSGRVWLKRGLAAVARFYGLAGGAHLS